MSARARLDRLLLLNWRGFFFQSFELHEAVTALEGENGAGKTTVMIAAFVALLPDPQRLSFRNIGEGEGGDGDRGVYGRLGARGPSYSILDLRTADGARVLAGVCLLRGGPPQIEFRRFVIEGLPADLDPADLLLVREDGNERIPELADLRAAVAAVGAALKFHESVGRYCGHLNDLGVLPMRMEQPAERQRFHQMLHTSMYGGFSRSLQTGLRDYLLNEDQRLRNHVARMRENLEACRITRRRIGEAEGRYRLIEEVYRYGWGMAEAAFHGTRLFARTRRASADEARAAHRRRRAELREAETEHERLGRRHREVAADLERRRAAEQEAAELRERCQRARTLQRALEDLAPRRAAEMDALAAADADCARARTVLTQARERHAREARERDELSGNLASAQRTFEAVARKVGQYRTAERSLADARAALPDHQVAVETLDVLLAESETRWQTALTDQSTARQALDGAALRRTRFDALLAVLGTLAGTPVPESEAAAGARRIDRELRELETLVEQSADLPRRIERAAELAGRQGRLRQRLAPLSARCGPLERAAQVRDAQAAATEQRRALESAQAECRERSAELRGTLARAGDRAAALERELTAWREAQALAEGLAPLAPGPLDGPAALTALRTGLERRDEALALEVRETETRRKQAVEAARQLEFGGGRLDESLVGLADRLDGRLLAERYDAVPAAEAARTEARLGPLHAALLVPDARAAAVRAAAEGRGPEHLWLVEAGGSALAPGAVPGGGGAGLIPPGETLGNAELVRMGEGWRLSRHPARPVVGRAAREQEIARLRAEAEALSQARADLRAERDQVRAQLEQAGRLAAAVHQLGRPSPESELRAQRRTQEEAARQLREEESRLADLKPRLTAAIDLGTALDACLADAGLLDDEDWSAAHLRLRREQRAVQAARERLTREAAAIRTLRDGFLELLQPPPDAAELAALRRRLEDGGRVLDYWGTARHLLADLADRRPHFGYADQVPLLMEQEGALETLKARLADLGLRTARLELEKDAAEQAAGEANGRRNQADAVLQATLARQADLERQLAETGEDGSREALAAAERLHTEARRDLEAADREERELATALALAAAGIARITTDCNAARADWRRTLTELAPYWRNWIALKAEARGLGLIDRLGTAAETYAAMGPPNVVTLASERRGQLGEALKRADGGAELAGQLARGRDWTAAEGSAGLRDLRAWVEVHRFLEQSIPRDISQSDDPQVALGQIGRHLEQLRERLLEQEQGLRHSTEDIANSIQVRIRREEARLNGLNRGLGRVRFGSIRGVRIHLERQPMMFKLLDAMRTQPDLFEQDAPLEDALATVYRHIGGGQIQGEHLLDYRQYIRIAVQVQRLGHDTWQEARAGALSTGESIGVGAAVLVVVLDAWEQQAALLRGRRAGQALRLLFLDEANRLSPESLDTLTELCEQMQVQLLAAAPAADRARRGHIYRLVRRTDASGEEEVVVRGRRMRDPAEGGSGPALSQAP